MKPMHSWHFTPLGRFILFLGSIQLAVPVMILVAIAMAWGTYLESKHGVQTSRATVYGSWWFITLMGLICVSLIFAVITRYPWKKKHVGFITVHAALVMLICGGFWSLFGRLEGHIAIKEGASSNILEIDGEVLQISEFKVGTPTLLGDVKAPHRAANLNIAGTPIEVVEFWDNTNEERYIANDGPQQLRAVEMSLDPAATSGNWIGEESKAGGPATMSTLTIRVLSDGESWTPPTLPKDAEYFFSFEGKQVPLKNVGEEILPGWTIDSVQRFTRAMVSDGKVTDTGTRDNPAIEVVIKDGKGNVERHTSFRAFPDMAMSRMVEGTTRSGATLAATATAKQMETLVIYGPLDSTKLGYIDSAGVGKDLGTLQTLPTILDLGARKVKIFNQFSNAREATRIVKAPLGGDQRPAMVVKVPGLEDQIVIPWKGFERIPDPSRNLLLSYGPRTIELPFTIELKDFRKDDYPGTEMAMAYESEVIVKAKDKPDTPFVIHMNAPFASYPWKVYQSGFSGTNISIFSVMRDPGLKLTYLASALLCVGIFITFFSRSLSWGHPGIPAPHLETSSLNQKEVPNVPKTTHELSNAHSVANAPVAAAAVHPEQELMGQGV